MAKKRAKSRPLAFIFIFCWQFSNQYSTDCIDSVYFKQNSATFYSIQHNCILSVVHITINKLSNCYYHLLNTDVNCILLYFILLYCIVLCIPAGIAGRRAGQALQAPLQEIADLSLSSSFPLQKAATTEPSSEQS